MPAIAGWRLSARSTGDLATRWVVKVIAPASAMAMRPPSSDARKASVCASNRSISAATSASESASRTDGTTTNPSRVELRHLVGRQRGERAGAVTPLEPRVPRVQRDRGRRVGHVAPPHGSASHVIRSVPPSLRPVDRPPPVHDSPARRSCQGADAAAGRPSRRSGVDRSADQDAGQDHDHHAEGDLGPQEQAEQVQRWLGTLGTGGGARRAGARRAGCRWRPPAWRRRRPP